MTSRFNKHGSIYGDYVEERLVAMSGVGGTQLTFKQMANVLGLSPTHNLRKRLRSAEKKGLVFISYEQTPTGGTRYLYTVPDKSIPPSDLSDIPF